MGASLATAELTRDRLRAALPRLQEQLKQAREREYAECWLNDYAAVKARRDAVAQQLRERYPAGSTSSRRSRYVRFAPKATIADQNVIRRLVP